MAKNGKHLSHIETMYDIISRGERSGIWHLYSSTPTINRGRKITIDGQELINFGSCSYLGLDHDPRLTQGVIKAVQKHGTQLSSSRTYLSSDLYLELESLFEQLFGYPVVIAPSTTLGHLSSIPVLVERDHAVILDQSVHASVQEAVQGAKARGVYVDIIRHNRIDWLEDKIKKLRQKHDVIWYMADGIYSMYGDECPVEDVFTLIDKYPELHFYVDDAHGLSWSGKNGSGYILSKVKLHERMILTTSLHKAFGSTGGVIICPNRIIAEKIKFCGNTLVFSGPIVPPMLGAAIESAKIHLSDEIYNLQEKLKSRVWQFNKLAETFDLPYPVKSESPIIFIGVGQPNVGYNMAKRLINEGFYTNFAMFPAVPIKKTGIRMCVTLHQKEEDIENVMSAIAHHLPRAIEEEEWTINKIQKVFGLPLKEDKKVKGKEYENDLQFYYFTSISNVNQEHWNKAHGKSLIDFNYLKFLENTFQENLEKENNWNFHYIMVYDKDNNLIASTFFTNSIWKDDMLAKPETSKSIEIKRNDDPYYMTSNVLSMGCLLSEGSHLFLEQTNNHWKKALKLILDKVYKIQEEFKITSIILRDFPKNTNLKDTFFNEGFFNTNMPDTFNIDLTGISSVEDYINSLSRSSKRHIKRYILPFEDLYHIKLVKNVSDQEFEHIYNLYLNVQSKSHELNTFPLPKKFFRRTIENPDLWDVYTFTLKSNQGMKKPVAVLFSYKNSHSYCPLIIGLNYNFTLKFGAYRIAHYCAIKRAIELGSKEIRLAFSAPIEKLRLGAKANTISMFADNKDNFSIEAMSML